MQRCFMLRLLFTSCLSLTSTAVFAETFVDFGNMKLDRSQVQAAQQAAAALAAQQAAATLSTAS